MEGNNQEPDKLSFREAVRAVVNGRNYLVGQGFATPYEDRDIVLLDGKVTFPDESEVTWNTLNSGLLDNILIRIAQEGGTFERLPRDFPCWGDDNYTRPLVTFMEKEGYEASLHVEDPSLLAKLYSNSTFQQIHSVFSRPSRSPLIRHPKYFSTGHVLNLVGKNTDEIDFDKINELEAGLKAAMKDPKLSTENLTRTTIQDYR